MNVQAPPYDYASRLMCSRSLHKHTHPTQNPRVYTRPPDREQLSKTKTIPGIENTSPEPSLVANKTPGTACTGIYKLSTSTHALSST